MTLSSSRGPCNGSRKGCPVRKRWMVLGLLLFALAWSTRASSQDNDEERIASLEARVSTLEQTVLALDGGSEGASGGLAFSGEVALYGTPNFDLVRVGFEQSRCVGGADGKFSGYFAGATVGLFDEDGQVVGQGVLGAGYYGAQDNPLSAVCVMTFQATNVARAREYVVVVDGAELGRSSRSEVEESRWFLSVNAA